MGDLHYFYFPLEISTASPSLLWHLDEAGIRISNLINSDLYGNRSGDVQLCRKARANEAAETLLRASSRVGRAHDFHQQRFVNRLSIFVL